MIPSIHLPAPRQRPSAGPEALHPTPDEAYRWAIWHGWTEQEAVTLEAHMAGIPIAYGEAIVIRWNRRTVEHLRFLRGLVQSGRLADDT